MPKTTTIADSNYFRFPLFVVAKFYNAGANTGLVNTDPLLLGEMQGEGPASLWSQHFCQLINVFCFMSVSVPPHLS